MMALFTFVTGSLKEVTEQLTRWFRQPVPASKTSQKQVLRPGTSKETEIKLTNVARASLEELLIDYKDFIRIHHLKEWEKNHRYVIRLRELNKDKNGNHETFRKGIENKNPEICANVMIGLIKVTTYLLDRLLRHLEQEFLKEGGLRERMTRARINQRNKGQQEHK